jgi:Zn-dependent metalloprotease
MYTGSIASASVPVTADKVSSTYYLRNAGTPAYYTCDMRNGRSSCSYITNTTGNFGTGTITTSGPNAAADAEFGAEMTLSYYKAEFGRNGIDNKNMPTYSRVHYSRVQLCSSLINFRLRDANPGRKKSRVFCWP